MRIITFVIIYLLFLPNINAQGNIDSIVSQVLLNNKTLEAYRKSTDAEKIGNKTGIYLQNPEGALI